MAVLNLTCPCCGYPATDERTVRCPRCNHPLQLSPGCPGECRECIKKRKIKISKKRVGEEGKSPGDALEGS
ncbi:MAG: hypothetical protein K6U04_04975 [Armatimonadetes bacterium]|nr:hypothetical protein [Armatimonadota bacterium]